MKIKQYDPQNTDQTGVIYGEPNEVYHSNGAVSNSKLGAFIDRAGLYHKQYVTKELPRKETKAMLEGSMLHKLLLEGEENYLAEYIVEPETHLVRPTAAQINAVKKTALAQERIAFWSSWDNVNKDKTIVTRAEDELVRSISHNAWTHPIASRLLHNAAYEVTFRTEKLGLGFNMQCKVDCLQNEGNPICEDPYILDVKKIVSLKRIQKDIVDFGYYKQAGFYFKTIETVLGYQPYKEFLFIFIESTEPFQIAIVRLKDTCLQMGISHITDDLMAFSEAVKNDSWDYVDSLKREKYVKPWKTEIVDINDNDIITLDFPTSYYMQAAENI